MLEKVAFQNNNDFKKIISVFKLKKIKAWVNCPRRMYPVYKYIKTKTNNEKKIEIIVKGNNWGMACNTIHFIDLISYFSNQNNFKFASSNLKKKIFKAKRKNCIEVRGYLKILSSRGDILHLYDDSSFSNSREIIIKTKSHTFTVFEEKELLYIENHIKLMMV